MNLKEIESLENAYCSRAMIAPHWLPSSNSLFWYRRWLSESKYCFTFVDCESGRRQDLFNHKRLASELAAKTDCDVNAETLPIDWLSVDPDGRRVRFQFHDSIWQATREGDLAEWIGDLEMPDVFVNAETSRSSPKSSTSAKVTLANLSRSSIRYFWVDYNGNCNRRNGLVKSGASTSLVSLVGMRFRLEQHVSGKQVVMELTHQDGVYTVEDTLGGLMVTWHSGAFSSDERELKSASIPEVRTELKPFIRQHNVWVHSPDGVEKQVSYDGFEDDSYRLIHPTQDGYYAVSMQRRTGSKHPLYLMSSVPQDQLRPQVIERDQVLAGDFMSVDRPRLFNLVTGQPIHIDDSLFRNPFSIKSIGWSPCGRKYRFLFNERGHKHVRLLEVDLRGEVSVLADESSDTVVNYHQKLHYELLEETRELIWMSERDGWNHLYLYDLQDGNVKNQITRGEWLVRSVEYVDVAERKIWFTAYGMIADQDLYHAHLACVDFDGSNLRLLTREDGTHSWQWGPGRRFLIDTWSRVDLLPTVAVIEVATGKQTVLLHREEIPSEVHETYHPIERLHTKARDGTTDIHGVIVRPSAFDPSKKYPIMEVIYAHPFQFSTPKKFQHYARYRRIADEGYIVVVIDGMGTNWRSKAFLDVSYKNVQDAGLPDRVLWIRAAASTRPFMDVSRVGIQGTSHGGSDAAAAVLHHGDFYRAACAEAGVHDLRMGNIKWTEMYMGWPVDDSYVENSNVQHARKLREDTGLMLVTGELDEVVEPACTMQFVDALVQADKDFELVVVPGQGHVIDGEWVRKKKARFFKRYLGGPI